MISVFLYLIFFYLKVVLIKVASFVVIYRIVFVFICIFRFLFLLLFLLLVQCLTGQAQCPITRPSFGNVQACWLGPAHGLLISSLHSRLVPSREAHHASAHSMSRLHSMVASTQSLQEDPCLLAFPCSRHNRRNKIVFHEIMPQALSLMADVFGNYAIQKFLSMDRHPK